MKHPSRATKRRRLMFASHEEFEAYRKQCLVVSRNLLAFKKKHKLTFLELGEKCGLSPGFLQKVVKGEAEVGAYAMGKLVAALGPMKGDT